jgi:hypothetical protein
MELCASVKLMRKEHDLEGRGCKGKACRNGMGPSGAHRELSINGLLTEFDDG